MELRKKITISICIIVLISLVTLCMSIYRKSAEILNEEANKFTEIQILRAQEKIDLLVDRIKMESKLLARDKYVIDFLNNKITNEDLNLILTYEMISKNQKDNYYKDLFIVDLEGVIIASTMSDAMYVDLSEREYIQKSFFTHQTQTSDILIALTDGKNIVNTVTPIYNESQEIIGLAGIAIRAENFVNFIKDYNVGQTGYFVIIDSNGYILSHKDTSLIGSIYSKEISGLENIHTRDENLQKTYDDVYLYTYKKMKNNDWILLTLMPKEELNVKSVGLLKYVLIYGFIISISAIFFSIFLSKQISRPIIHITNYIDKAKNNNQMLDDAIYHTRIDVENDKFDFSLDNLSLHHVESFLDSARKKMDKNFNLFEEDAKSLIKKSKDLSSSLEMKSYLTVKFLSTLSHDIRTSLTLIKGYAKGLLSNFELDEDTKNRFVEEIYDSAENLQNIVNDVLDSTYEAHCTNESKKEYVKSYEFCEYLFHFSKEYIENSDRIFIGNFNCGNELLYINKIKIIRVWQNILSNAIKYTEEFTNIYVTICKEHDKMLFKIKDEGMGIRENDKEYICEMFYKSNLSDKNSYGLGLFISKSILNTHHSDIYFESELSKGSTFWFNLDLKPENREE
ncbi:His Kinase A (phospho-acceptor) domain-containing protein [Anaerovirgula multivorans]|uniref:histidine kinase n=1 Tax=Anaerovirgula multivorans TaxID=312168 RepID=A0A239DE59_9FIRM|nr:sensor histidine kinase [Anaerovirgula multivorans]SNS30649.1 His Kinase A (phospho-acceptor) domain-containing protein [Anaerovirgula multivorans]